MIEIKELVIKATITENGRNSNNPDNNIYPNSPMMSEDDRNLLLEDCVRQVLRILDRRNER